MGLLTDLVGGFMGGGGGASPGGAALQVAKTAANNRKKQRSSGSQGGASQGSEASEDPGAGPMPADPIEASAKQRGSTTVPQVSGRTAGMEIGRWARGRWDRSRQ